METLLSLSGFYEELKTQEPTLLQVLTVRKWKHLAPHIKFGKPNNYWTKERCLEAAKKFTILKEFKHTEKTAYATIVRNGWLDELKLILISCKPNGFWQIKHHCIDEAKKYNSRSEFAKKAVSAYKECRKNKWLDEACSHMKKVTNNKLVKE